MRCAESPPNAVRYGAYVSTRRARTRHSSLINQLQPESASLRRSPALSWWGDSLHCSIVQHDGAAVISGGFEQRESHSHPLPSGNSIVPIVVLTARVQEAQRLPAFDADADDYVIKPLTGFGAD